MASVEQQLWSLVSEIEPTPTQKAGAVRSQNHLRDVLNTGQMANRIKASYLSGSYARDTAIYPLDDVDIIFVIDPNYWVSGLALLFEKPRPEAVLQTFASAIRYRYPVSSTYGQRRSVRLELYHLDIDCVPAIEESAGSDFVWIPDRSADDWIKSSPKRHSAQATAVNQLNGGKLKPLVKLLKYWNGNLPSTANVRSFMIETMALTLFKSRPCASLEQGLLMFFDFVASFAGQASAFTWSSHYGMSAGILGGMLVPDLAGTGTNVAAKLESTRRDKLLEHAVRSRDRMLEAQRALSQETAVNRVARALRSNA
jgi:hypothetical protein